MESVATRDSIACYERATNALLEAISPGGILYDAPVRGPFEALLLPREIALRVYALSPYLRLGATGEGYRGRHGISTPPPPSCGECVASSSDRNADTSDLDWSEVDNTELKKRLREVTSAEVERIRQVMDSLLRYHLIHFDGAGNSRFTTARGDRGGFSETLDSVQRFGRFGKAVVITDMDALVGRDGIPPLAKSGTGPRNRNGVHAWQPPAGQTAMPPSHPATLQIYLIDQLLMDTQELRQLTSQLDKIVRTPATHHRHHAHDTDPQAATAAAVRASDGRQAIPCPPPTEAAVPTSPRPHPVAPTAAVRYNGLQLDASAVGEGEDDIVVEEDLSPYVSKSNRRERMLQEREHTALPSARRCESANHVLLSAPATPAVAAPPVPAQKVHSASAWTSGPVSSAPGPAAPPTPPHANLLNHQYSKESIKDYRSVVAADNEIGYKEFECIMETASCLPLVVLVSNFIEAAQMRGRGFKDNSAYLRFLDNFQAEVEKIPSVRDNARRVTVLSEGVEKYVTTKLYFQFFNVDEHERELNNLLRDKLQRVERLSARQLDALDAVERHHVWGQAMFELDGMNFFKSPREKLRCGMRACELLSLAVGDILAARQRAKRSSPAAAASPPSYAEVAADPARGALPPATPTYATTANQDHGHAASLNANPVIAFGADEFLPCFMLLVLRAQPYNYFQNLQYIDKFRAEHLRAPEESYCLANLMAAYAFWMNCNDEGRLDSDSSPAKRPADTHRGGGGGGGEAKTATHSPPSAALSSPHGISGAATRTVPPVGDAAGKAKARGTLVTATALPTSATVPPRAVSTGTVVTAPVMHEKDLLPSVRQASSIRVGMADRRLSVPVAAAAKAAPQGSNTMDKLFD